MNQYSVKDLQRFDILSECSVDQLRMIKSSVYWRTYKKGQLLFIEDDPRERIYFLLKGFVKLSRLNQSGKLIYADYVKPYTMFPCVGLFNDRTYHFSAEAATDLELFYIPTKLLEEQLKRNKNYLLKIVSSLSDILKMHENRVQQIPNAQHRVHQTLQNLMNDLGREDGQGIVVDCPITTTEIAHLSGTSRETVSQVFKQLKADNILSCVKKKLIFHKPSFFYDFDS